ncbi:hypothetical protein [Streptosporangium sp. CA-115845]|uniref:hypothetical protein n=1 Tax=Streptosporangium sp. CA-115845 TaxID=3240071 RepID=UPI003D9235A9
MATVKIKIRTARTQDGKRVIAPYDEVDLDELSPRARALAEAISHCAAAVADTIRLRSDKRIRDTQLNWEHYFTPEQADQPLTMDWARWDKYPADSPMSAVEWLERQAAKIPPGWRIVGATRSSLGGEPLVQVEDSSTLMTAEQVAAYLATHGRHMTAASWRSKAHPSKRLAPPPTDRVGRTPLWEQVDVDAWLNR